MSISPDPNGVFAMALKDLRALEGMANDYDHFSDEVFGFHAQQAVEKSLKTWIAALGIEYPHTHDLSLLLQILQQQGISINEWIDLLELGSFSVQLRYEELTTDDEPIDRPVMVKRIKSLIEQVKKAVEKKTGN